MLEERGPKWSPVKPTLLVPRTKQILIKVQARIHPAGKTYYYLDSSLREVTGAQWD